MGRMNWRAKMGRDVLTTPLLKVCDDLHDCDDNSDEDTGRAGCCMHRVIFNKRMDILGQPFSKAPTAGLKKKLKNCLKRTPDKLGGDSKEKTRTNLKTRRTIKQKLYLSSDMIFFNLPHAFAEQIFWSEGSATLL